LSNLDEFFEHEINKFEETKKLNHTFQVLTAMKKNQKQFKKMKKTLSKIVKTSKRTKTIDTLLFPSEEWDVENPLSLTSYLTAKTLKSLYHLHLQAEALQRKLPILTDKP